MKADCSEAGPAGYAIKKAESGHIPLLNDIELAAATLFPEGYLPEHILSDKLPIDLLESAKEEERLIVAVDRDDSPVGYILFEIIDGLALVAQIDVHPEHGQQGLGTALIIQGIQEIRRRGYDELYLTTFSDIKWNGKFYNKLGFRALIGSEIPGCMARILQYEKDRGLNSRICMRLKFTGEAECAWMNYYQHCMNRNNKKNCLIQMFDV